MLKNDKSVSSYVDNTPTDDIVESPKKDRVITISSNDTRNMLSKPQYTAS